MALKNKAPAKTAADITFAEESFVCCSFFIYLLTQHGPSYSTPSVLLNTVRLTQHGPSKRPVNFGHNKDPASGESRSIISPGAGPAPLRLSSPYCHALSIGNRENYVEKVLKSGVSDLR
jgi:hypothetical protein